MPSRLVTSAPRPTARRFQLLIATTAKVRAATSPGEDGLDPGILLGRCPGVCQVGQGLAPGQGGPLTVCEERGLAPCGDGVQPHRILTSSPRVTSVHRQAVGTAIHLRRTDPDKLQKGRLQRAIAQRLLQPQQGRHAIRELDSIVDPHDHTLLHSINPDTSCFVAGRPGASTSPACTRTNKACPPPDSRTRDQPIAALALAATATSFVPTNTTLAIQEVERRRGSRVNRQGLLKAEAYENHPQLLRLVQQGHLRPDLREGDWTAPIRRTAMPWLRPLAPRKCPTSRTAAGSPAPRRARVIRRRAGRIGASSSLDRALDDCSSPRP
jgi:hypothetical protein